MKHHKHKRLLLGTISSQTKKHCFEVAELSSSNLLDSPYGDNLSQILQAIDKSNHELQDINLKFVVHDTTLFLKRVLKEGIILHNKQISLLSFENHECTASIIHEVTNATKQELMQKIQDAENSELNPHIKDENILHLQTKLSTLPHVQKSLMALSKNGKGAHKS